MDKKNSNLTEEQKFVLYKEGTEAPGSSPLNNEKREGSYYCIGCEQNYLSLKQNMKVDQGGHLFLNLYLMFLRQKPIII